MINGTDTAFVLAAAGLVLLMTPGLALFYAGMVRSKNALATIMQSLVLIALVSLQWVWVGYSLSFGPDLGGFIGSLAWAGLRGVTTEPSTTYATTVPHLVFMIYQCMFAVITPALIAGAFAERMRFPAFVVFSLLWALVVYNPVCHWVWGSGGWLARLGVLDFAGGLVVHATSGMAALAAVLVIGPRRGFGHASFMPHNLPMTMLGTGLLWFGWFGFNGGSALAANATAATAFVATHLAGMAGMAMWTAVEWVRLGRPTTLGAASGAIAGLGGGAELLGTQFRLINGFGAGYGFDGVAMALIGQLHPIATMVVALFFAVLRVGSTTMQAATGVPTSVSDIIQALVIVFSVAGMALTKLPEFQAWKDRVFSKRKAGDK